MEKDPGRTGPPDNATPAPTGEGEAKPVRRRALVIDDNPDGADLLAMMIGIAGHDARTAHDGPEGLAIAREYSPEVVFVDIMLPGMNGYEVAVALRADPKLAGVFLVAVTGRSSSDDVRRAIEAGFDLHLAKPIEASAVAQALTRVRATVPADRP